MACTARLHAPHPASSLHEFTHPCFEGRHDQRRGSRRCLVATCRYRLRVRSRTRSLDPFGVNPTCASSGAHKLAAARATSRGRGRPRNSPVGHQLMTSALAMRATTRARLMGLPATSARAADPPRVVELAHRSSRPAQSSARGACSALLQGPMVLAPLRRSLAVVATSPRASSPSVAADLPSRKSACGSLQTMNQGFDDCQWF